MFSSYYKFIICFHFVACKTFKFANLFIRFLFEGNFNFFFHFDLMQKYLTIDVVIRILLLYELNYIK